MRGHVAACPGHACLFHSVSRTFCLSRFFFFCSQPYIFRLRITSFKLIILSFLTKH